MESPLKIKLNSVLVADQEAALRFYTEVLGFRKQMDIPAGAHRWLTVVSPDEPDGTQLLLEPNANAAAATYQHALFDARIPCTSFAVDDIDAEYRRLKTLGVSFVGDPVNVGTAIVAVFDDSCGNFLQIYQEL